MTVPSSKEEPKREPEISRPVSVSPPKRVGMGRPLVLGCLSALGRAVGIMEDMEGSGELQRMEYASEYVRAVITLHDKLELFVKTAPPGEPFEPTAEDRRAADLTADFLEAMES